MKQMKGKILFPQRGELLHGGDYNPEQWRKYPEILKRDIELMKEAKVNAVSIGIFSWAAYEPEEGVYDFSWMDEVTDRLWEAGISFILATPSGARPAWMDRKYPQVMRVDSYGVRNHHGVRHNHCITSRVYREKVRRMDQMLARRYGSHPGLLLWHISNEFGGECYCQDCQEKFRQYLRKKYNNDINELNEKWWAGFWSHSFSCFEEIEAPMSNGETCLPILNLEWKRFTTENTADFIRNEISALKEITPQVPVTTNFMWMFEPLNYHQIAKDLDIISWDSYPFWHCEEEPLWVTGARTAFNHSMMRNMKPDRPFLLMESTPSLVNWMPYNKLKRPGMALLSAGQALACGSDSVLYFQWRKGRGGIEQFHGAVVDHDGRDDARVFREVAETGSMLEERKEILGTLVESKAAILFDWNNWWALEYMQGMSRERNYGEYCFSWYQAFLRLGIDADVIGPDRDFSDYDILVAPMLFLCDQTMGDRLSRFAKEGGTLIGTWALGYVDETFLAWLGGFPGAGLSQVFGLTATEIDALYPSDRNSFVWKEKTYEVKNFCEILEVKDAQVLASYDSDFYRETPALTRHAFGKGAAYYLACQTEDEFLLDFLREVLAEKNIGTVKLPAGCELHVRKDEEKEFWFYLNYTQEEKQMEGRSVPGLSMQVVRQK